MLLYSSFAGDFDGEGESPTQPRLDADVSEESDDEALAEVSWDEYEFVGGELHRLRDDLHKEMGGGYLRALFGVWYSQIFLPLVPILQRWGKGIGRQGSAIPWPSLLPMWDLDYYEETGGEERVVGVLWECIFWGAVQRAESSTKKKIPQENGYYLYPTPEGPIRVQIIWPEISVNMVRKLADIHSLLTEHKEQIEAALGSDPVQRLEKMSVNRVQKELRRIVTGDDSDRGSENDQGEESEEGEQEEEEDGLESLKARILVLEAQVEHLQKRKQHYKSLYKRQKQRRQSTGQN